MSLLTKKLTIAGLFLAVLAGVSCFFPIIPTLQSLCNWIGDFGLLGILILALLLAAGSLIFLPASPFIIGGAAVFGFGWGLLCALVGVSLGATGGFFLSRGLLRKDISTHFRKHATFRAIDQAIEKEGWKIVILLRLCPIPFGLANYLYGLTGVRYRPYLFATLIGGFPSTLLFCQLGSAGKASLQALASGRSDNSIGHLVILALSILAPIAAIILIPRFAKRAVAKYTEGGSL